VGSGTFGAGRWRAGGVGCKLKMLFVWTSDDNGSCAEGARWRRGRTGDVVATVHVITNNPERDSL